MVIVIGVVAGVSAHLGYFNTYSAEMRATSGLNEMEWLRSELDLTEEQFARITRLHDDRESEIRTLSRKVRDLELMLAELEAERVTEGYVDYLEIRNYMEAKRKLDEACSKSTNDLIASVGDVMDLEQRRRYLTIVQGSLN
ncbi:hypothetical protein [Pelagicoccus mobilis]|uniref:Uncharacterized protein n=2 Tax=Pelagicoccus mobilis TaxID=415221 RepID=A0A934S742_9BACT|nr:hypothetical protein [Pelagicoccus mobilis]MBK1880584.1 hypothetical protein [Pelagicoccus mobilis]